MEAINHTRHSEIVTSEHFNFDTLIIMSLEPMFNQRKLLARRMSFNNLNIEEIESLNTMYDYINIQILQLLNINAKLDSFKK